MANWPNGDDWDRPRKRNGARWIAVGIALVAVYAVGIVTGTSLRVSNVSSQQATTGGPGGNQASGVPSSTGVVNNSSADGTGLAMPPGVGDNLITRVYRTVRPSIFTITAITSLKSSTGPQEDIGTGFLIDDNGDIATNDHVIKGAKYLSVSTANQTYRATVVGTDPVDDLAIVHFSPPAGLHPLTLGSTQTLQPGQLVIAIGNPFQLTASVSAGIVSGLDRSMPVQGGRLMDGLVQTDAPLNPGNSGGPLLDSAGRVVGINTFIESPVQGSVGVGFAIPVDRLRRLLPQLLSGQPVQHSWLGIEAIDIDPGVQLQYKLTVAQGILVFSTAKGGPAARAGVHGDTGGSNHPVGDGDIIVAIDGQPVQSVADLTTAINSDAVGTVVHLTILRHGQRIQLPVTLGAWPGH